MTAFEYSQLLRNAKEIANLDKTPGYVNSGDAYAHALGKANGIAKMMLIILETLKPEATS